MRAFIFFFFSFPHTATVVEIVGRAEGQRHRLHDLPEEGPVPQAVSSERQQRE